VVNRDDRTSWRELISPARVAIGLTWTAALLALGLSDEQLPWMAISVLGYAAFLIVVGAWLLPDAVPIDCEEVLRAVGTRTSIAARWCVVITTGLLVYALGFALTAYDLGKSGSFLIWLAEALRGFRLWPGMGGVELFKLGLYVLVPGALLLILGARPRELGLRIPARGTILATLVCLVPSASFVGWGVASHRLSGLGLFLLLVHNLLSNGLSEEFLCRGMMLSHLRAFFKTDWALLIQALLFALMHFQINGSEEETDPLRSLAEDIALNLPLGLAFGYLALRSRSLVLPTLLHMFRWVP
jgi:membrane protease YdiL (CAAX protease family)